MKALKKLHFSFRSSSLVLNDLQRFCDVYPNLTDLKLNRGTFCITNSMLEALPRTLKRLELLGSFLSSASSNEDINLTLLAKLTQNLECLKLRQFTIVLGANETLEQFEFSDSLLELWVDSLHYAALITKLPRFIEHVSIGFHSESKGIFNSTVSMLPVTLKTFILLNRPHKAQFVIDGPFPPHLERWEAKFKWESVSTAFPPPSSYKEGNIPIQMFGKSLELIPKSLREINVTGMDLRAEQVENLPAALWRLTLGQSNDDVFLKLPKTLRSLTLVGPVKQGVLDREVCERMENLEELDCSSDHLALLSDLNAFIRLKGFVFNVKDARLTKEGKLFSHLSEALKDSLETIRIIITRQFGPLWPVWMAQLTEYRKLTSLACILDTFCGDNWLKIPTFLKCLPPSLTQLQVPPIPLSKPMNSLEEEVALIASPEFRKCFRHLPKSLIDLHFGFPRSHPEFHSPYPLRLSDDCFAHLPPSITHLSLSNVCGITEQFWDVIPPHIGYFVFSDRTLQSNPSFRKLEEEYFSKLGAF
jgi:hypothetical protein